MFANVTELNPALWRFIVVRIQQEIALHCMFAIALLCGIQQGLSVRTIWFIVVVLLIF